MSDFDPTEYNMTIKRTFDAPRDGVWQALTDPDEVRQWWGPKGFTVPRCEMDLRPGGVHRVDMRASDGAIIPHEGVIEEVDEPERLVIYNRNTENGEETQQPEVRNTITLVEHDGRTELTFVAEVTAATPDITDSLEGMEPVWSESLDSLSTYLGEV
ncbi:SRPBCC family protein [Haladaptatus sp. NG-SE-30]